MPFTPQLQVWGGPEHHKDLARRRSPESQLPMRASTARRSGPPKSRARHRAGPSSGPQFALIDEQPLAERALRNCFSVSPPAPRLVRKERPCLTTRV
jgi:hypothetical protein